MSLAEHDVHDRILDLAAAAIDGHLTAAEAAELRKHLESCPACARRSTAMRNDSRRLATPLMILPSRRTDDAVRAAIARPHGGARRELVFAAAALLLLALLGAIAVGALLLQERKVLPTTVLPTKPPVAVVSPVPQGSPSTVGETWEAIEFGPTSVSVVKAVAISGSDLVGVGRGGCVPDFDSPTACYGAAWTAAPGEGWRQAPDHPGLEVGVAVPMSGPEKGMSDVVSGPAGLVAIGHDYDPPRSACDVAPCTSGPAVWRSADGRTWERVHIDLGPSAIDRFPDPIAAIAAGPRGYIIVGYAADYAAPGPGLPAHATAWTSPDGLVWTRATDSADLDVGICFDTGEAPDCGGMRAVVATATGFVAVGETIGGGSLDRRRPAAWTSPDGLHWTRADAGLDFNGRLSGVATTASGLVAVGTVCSPDCSESTGGGIVATSADGSTWSAEPLAGSAPLSGVASAGQRLFAVGVVLSDGDPPMQVEVWGSADGAAWERVIGLPTITEAYGSVDIAATPDRVVIVGWQSVAGTDFPRNFAFASPASPGAAPVRSGEPTPRCPAPATAVKEPTVWAAIGSGPRLVTTPGAFTVTTCSTTRTDDRVPPAPSGELEAQPGDTIRLTLPPGWVFLGWAGYDSAVAGDGSNVWPAVVLLDEPSTLLVPVPHRGGLSQVGLTLTLSGEDDRAIAYLDVVFLVRVDEPTP